MGKRKAKQLNLTDHQANVIACAALRNLVVALHKASAEPEVKSILAVLDRAIEDGRENAPKLALGLLLAGSGAWEATRLARGEPSLVQQYEQIKVQTGGGRRFDA